MFGAEFTTSDALLLAVILILFVLLAMLGIAETGINRVVASRPRRWLTTTLVVAGRCCAWWSTRSASSTRCCSR